MNGPRTRRALLASIGVAVGVVALALAARARERSLEIVAHRGFATVVPENTLEAVRFAAPRADAVEIDVRRCGSGELVCLHDERLERVTDGVGRVDETDWATLRELSVDGTDAAPARLSSVLEAVPADVTLHVELKERGLADDLLDALEDREGPVVVSSFDPAALAEVRARDDAIPLAVTCRSDVDAALEAARTVEAGAIHPRVDRCLRTTVVPRAHRRGVTVRAWTVDSRRETALLALVGVDGVFADRPPRIG